MTDERRNPWIVAVPMLVAVALAGGLLLGYGLRPQDGADRGFFSVRQPQATDKIVQVIELLQDQYVDTIRKEELVDHVIEDLLQQLDPHSYYISAADLRSAQEPLEGSFEGIGVEFAIQRDTVVVIAPVEGGPSEKLGVRAGDRIIAANGKPLVGKELTNDEVMANLRGPGGSEVTVSILRHGQRTPFNVTIQRGKIPINSVAVSLMGEQGVGYIKLVRFARTTHAEFMEAAGELFKQGMKSLVIDLRGNGGGYLDQAIAIADEILPAGRMILYTEGRTHPRRVENSHGGGALERLPLAVLIDEGSASASEIVAGAIQDNDRGLIYGRRSFGKGLVQEHMTLPDSSAVRITTARYYTPSGRSIQRPYGEGIDYDAEYEKRFTDGELLNADSIRQDSARAYTTIGGRTVYGGGGIVPDVFVPADTVEASGYLSELLYTGVLNQFTFEVADRDRVHLTAFGDARRFADSYEVPAGLLEELANYAAKEGIPRNEGAMARSRRRIEERLKAGIGRNVWGAKGYYPVLLTSDSSYLKSREGLLAGKP